MQIKPIRTEEDYRAALAEVRRLWRAEPGSRAFDRLEIFGMLVEKYEAEQYAIDPPSGVDAILFRLEQLGLPRSALAESIGTRGRVSEVLSGGRPLTLAMIRKIQERFGISADVLIREMPKPTVKTARRGSKAESPRRRAPKPTRPRNSRVSKSD